MRDALVDTLLLASGGIVAGRGVAAALALGADGAWVGTRVLASPEANVHPEHHRRLLLPVPVTTGDFEEMPWLMGQGVGLVHEVMPAAEIVSEMMHDAAAIATRPSGVVTSSAP